MQSLKSRLIILAMKNRHLLQGKFNKEVVDWSLHENIIKFRQECEQGANRFGKLPDGIQVVPIEVNGLKAEWILPTHLRKDKVMFYVHGGGFVSGSCSDHRVHVAKFVKGSNIAAIIFEYRLAPEHPFPAALDDSLMVYQWLLSQGVDAHKIAFIGDSAGGGLLLATMLALKDKRITLPAVGVAISPWADLKMSGNSYTTNVKKCLSPMGMTAAFCQQYIGEGDAGHPHISPLYGELRGLPPLLIFAGSEELVRDDSVQFAEKARAAGVEVELHIGKGMFHCYPVAAPLFPEATQAMDHICEYIKSALEADS